MPDVGFEWLEWARRFARGTWIGAFSTMLWPSALAPWLVNRNGLSNLHLVANSDTAFLNGPSLIG